MMVATPSRRFAAGTPLLGVLLFCLLAAPATANPLLDAMRRAEPTPEALERARRQLENPPAKVLDDPLFVPSFHRHREEDALPATLCRSCHGTAPHRKNPLKRAFLNAHTRHIACETCHWRPKELSLTFHRLPESEDGHPGPIVPWLSGSPLFIPESDPEALRLKQQWDEADRETRIRLKAEIHQPLEQEGPTCTRCHRKKDPLLNLESLGYTAAQARELLLHPVPRFVEQSRPEKPGAEPRRIRIRELLE